MTAKSTVTSTIEFNGFNGIDTFCPVSGKAAASVTNFDLLTDGSLKKRPGYRQRISLPGSPTGFYMVNRNSSEIGYAIIGDSAYCLDFEYDYCYPLSGSLSTSPERVNMEMFHNNLILLDGTNFHLPEFNFSIIDGYAPLYGKGWHPVDGGEVFEPINLLSMYLRVNYSVESGTTEIILPLPVQSVSLVTINGTTLSPAQYSLDAASRTLTSNYFAPVAVPEASDVTVWFTMQSSNLFHPALCSCQCSAVCGGGNNAVMFCYNSRLGDNNMIYRSSPVAFDEYTESRRGFSNATDIYFPATNAFSVGNGGKSIKAILPIEDSVIIYTQDEAWIMPAVCDTPSPILFNNSIGCSSPYACAICGEYPVTACGQNIYLWEPNGKTSNGFNAICISKPVNAFIECNFSEKIKILYNSAANEILFFDPIATSNRILIYNLSEKSWTTSTGYLPNWLFYINNNTAFIENNSVCVLDSASDADYPNGSTATVIKSEYTGGWLDFGEPGKEKRLKMLILKAETNGQPISVTLEFDSDAPVTLDICTGSGKPGVYVQRLPRRRFRQIRLSFSTNSSVSQRLYEATIEATVSDK